MKKDSKLSALSRVYSGGGDCGVVTVLVGGWHVCDSNLINHKPY